MKILAIIIGSILLIFGLLIYTTFAWGFVASIIYGWFVLPIFPDAPTLNWLELAGLMFVVRCFIHPPNDQIKDEYKDNTSSMITGLILPWTLLFGAWLFKIIFL